MAAAARSMPEWAASESIPSEPVKRPVRSLSSVMMSAAKTDSSAAERLAACVCAASSGVTVGDMKEMLHGTPAKRNSPLPVLFAFGDGNVGRGVGRANVVGAGADKAVVVVLLDDMGSPAG